MKKPPPPPLCKCGQPCQFYGPTGGYSKQCPTCNDAKNRKSRQRSANQRQMENLQEFQKSLAKFKASLK